MSHKIISLVTLFAVTACGNNWMNSGDRAKTPSALRYQAKTSYDKGDYASAASDLESALSDDPTNQSIRLRLVYAYNGLAGMGLLDVIKNAAKAGQSLTEPMAADSGITQMTTIIGFSEADRQALIAAMGSNIAPKTKMATLRTLSTKLTYVHKAWTTVCSMVSKTVFDKYVGTDSKVISGLETSGCNGGQASSVDPAADFAGALSNIAEGVIVYGSVIDQNNDGVLDLQVRAQTVSDTITTIDNSTSAATSATQINSLLSQLSTAMKDLDAIGQEANGEVITSMIAEFQIAASLLGNIKGVPDSLKSKINDSISVFQKSKSTIDGYLSSANSKAQNAQVTNSTTTANKILNSLNTKISGLSAADQAASKQQFQAACTNYQSASGQFNIPAGTAAAACASN